MDSSKSTKARERLIDAATLVVAVSAIVLSVQFVWDRLAGPPPRVDRVIENWQAYASQGHRIGPTDPEVTILEFGDYECPYCGKMDSAIQGVLADPELDVALVFRHFPLSSHESAYWAARLAECASAQDRFSEAHQQLFREPDLKSLDPQVFAQTIEIPDEVGFLTCARDTRSVDRIEADLLVAEQLALRGTPSIIIGGTLLARPPDSAGLALLVREQMTR